MALYTFEYERTITIGGTIQVVADDDDEAYELAEELVLDKGDASGEVIDEDIELDIVSVVNDDGEEID